MIELGKNIKNLRCAKKMTQLELANKTNVTKSAISAYENETRLPSYDVLIKLAQIFHVSIDNLLGNSKKYTIDVSELTIEQRNVVQSIVSAYIMNNKILNEVEKK